MSSTDSPSMEKMQDEDWQQASQAKKQVFGLSFPQWVLFFLSASCSLTLFLASFISLSYDTHTQTHSQMVTRLTSRNLAVAKNSCFM